MLEISPGILIQYKCRVERCFIQSVEQSTLQNWELSSRSKSLNDIVKKGPREFGENISTSTCDTIYYVRKLGDILEQTWVGDSFDWHIVYVQVTWCEYCVLTGW